jgi:hypothetical protein
LNSSTKFAKISISSTDLTKITHEKITNSEELITTLPIANSNKKQHSKILLLKIDNQIKGAILTTLDESFEQSAEFTGKIIITDLNGEFVNGFKVQNGIAIASLVKKSISSQNSYTNKSNAEELNEVIIYNNYHNSYPVYVIFTPYHYGIQVEHDVLYDMDFGSGGGGGGAEPAVEAEDPCDELKKQTVDPVYQAKIQSLKSNTSLKKETGYGQNKDGTFTTLTANGPDAVVMPRDPNRVGYMHTHIDPYQKTNSDGDLIDVIPIKMFSPQDVQQFLILVVNAQIYGTPISDAYGMMVSSAGIYQLAFTGNVADINAKNSTINWGKSLDNIYVKYLRKNAEEGFLKFLKDKIGIDGIELYKVEDSGNAKIALDSNGKIVAINCN